MECDENVPLVPQPQQLPGTLSSSNHRFMKDDSDMGIAQPLASETWGRQKSGELPEIQPISRTPLSLHQPKYCEGTAHIFGVGLKNSLTFSPLTRNVKCPTPKMTTIKNKVDDKAIYSTPELMASKRPALKPEETLGSSRFGKVQRKETDLTGSQPTVGGWKTSDGNKGTEREDICDNGLGSRSDAIGREQGSYGAMPAPTGQSISRTFDVAAEWKLPNVSSTTFRQNSGSLLQRIDTAKKKVVLPHITNEMNHTIDWALRPYPPSEVLVQPETTGYFKQSITRRDIQTLNNTNWLNDEIINFYMALINVRSLRHNYMLVYAFNSFFFPKLMAQGYTESLARWTTKARVNVFTREMILVPIHLGTHWCMAAIDFCNKTVRYYDSLGRSNNECLNALLWYLNKEHENKRGRLYYTSDWKTENVQDIPKQMNFRDCGVFACMYAEFLSRNSKFAFSQEDMPLLRRKMVYEIVMKQLLQ